MYYFLSTMLDEITFFSRVSYSNRGKIEKSLWFLEGNKVEKLSFLGRENSLRDVDFKALFKQENLSSLKMGFS